MEHLEESVTVYNFEVEDYHTYYVGDAEVLVHNTCAAGGSRPPNLSPKGAGRTGAFKEAKRKNNIPVSQQPEKVGPNINKQGKIVDGKHTHLKSIIKKLSLETI